MGKGSGGRRGPKIDEQTKRLIGSLATGIYTDLKLMLPVADDKKLQKVALGSAQDQILTLRPLLQKLADPATTRLGLRLTRPSALVGGQDESLAFAAPRRLSDCSNLEETLSSATILSAILNPTVRAMLSYEGYRLSFMTGQADAEDSSKVIDLASKRKERKDEED